MKLSRLPGFFDLDERANKLNAMGDPLVGLAALIDWEAFRPALSVIRAKERKSQAGAKPIDAVLMFKVLVLQQLHNLSDDGIEYQIRDRLSFMRFLGLQLESRVPDAKTVGLFREHLKSHQLVHALKTQDENGLVTTNVYDVAGHLTIKMEYRHQIGLQLEWGLIFYLHSLFYTFHIHIF